MKELAVILLVLVGTMAIIPAYATVIEFTTDKTSYKKGDTILFSGKTDLAHANKMVSVKVTPPEGKSFLLAGGSTDGNGVVEIRPIDTTQGKALSKMTMKGIYNASLIYDEDPNYKGKWTIFDYSLDGSPVSPSAAQIMAQQGQSTSQPAQPTTPTQPTQPTTPSQPTQSSQPTQPTTPTQPAHTTCGSGTVFDEESQTCVVAPASQPEPQEEPEPESEPEPQAETPEPKTTKIPGFPDPTKDPQSYIDRYNNEPEYKAWFDRNFPDDTIYDIVGVDPPTPASACGAGTHEENGICVLDKAKGIGQCAIATAAFGTELAPQVQMLREIRDEALFGTASGTAFMAGFNEFYYAFSPTIADWERQSPLFKEMVKTTITPMLSTLSILSYVHIDSEQEMLGYGIGIILLNIGMYFVAPALVLVKVRRFFK